VDPMAVLVEYGMLLESACGPLPSVAELVAGGPIGGSWWGHPQRHEIFDAINSLAESPDVVRTRLVNGKVTLLHRRVWPALVRVTERYPPERLTAVREEHTSTGAHRVHEHAFSDWVPDELLQAGRELSIDDALAQCQRVFAPERDRPTDPPTPIP
jgi:hypothetical protein